MLGAARIALTLDGDSLVVKADKGSLNNEIRARLVEHKDELVEYFKSESGRCLHEYFEAVARRSPDAVATVHDGRTLSYGALNAQANRLAHHLVELGLGLQERVAIAVERGMPMVVGLLAILKAGGAYVPLDPVYSSDRLNLIIGDCAPRFVLCDAAGRAALDAHALAERILVDLEPLRAAPSAATPWSAQPDSDLRVAGLTPAALAYVIYTSGSTGVPKGVMVEHAQVARLFDASAGHFGFGSQDVWCLFHSYAFDFSVWEMWGAWRYGGRLVLVPHQTARSSADFYALVCREGVTVLNQTPGAFRAFIEEEQRSAHRHALRYVIFGGEALEPSMLTPWYERHPGPRPLLVNMYGITETTVHVTYRALSAQDCAKPGSLIGQPLPHLTIYLLDRHGRLVPQQAIGEIYVGGQGVARGYLNRAELTAERFLDDPFSSRPGARMYRSGDLGRYNADGELEYMGRNDQQVKIRGFRIELGEIEARLREHGQVRDAVVLARGEGAVRQLVAYVISTQAVPADEPDGGETLAAGWRSHLAARLPDYMVPSAFVRMSAWPLTPNGKLDRKALPGVDARSRAQRAYAAPQGRVEQVLATLWQELLGVERVGRDDHFFELGGHSLLAMQLIERLRQHDLHVAVRRLFAAPVLHELAAALGQKGRIVVPPNQIGSDSTAITPAMLPLIELEQEDIDRIAAQVPGGVANIQDIYGLAPLQDGILFHHRLTRDRDPYLMRTVVTFPDRALLDRFIAAVQQLVNRHDILRTAFFWEGLSAPAQVVLRQATLPVTELSLDPEDGPAAQQLSERFAAGRQAIDLSKPPLVSFVIARETGSEQWVALQMRHHLIEDAVSVTIYRDEINAIMQGKGDTLGEAPPYRNMVAQARLGLSAAEHEQYFRDMLGQVSEPTLPFGLTDVHRSGGQMTQHREMLPQQLAERLRAQARRLGVGLASLCHLAWGQVLARIVGHENVVFGTVLFGRMQGGDGADRAAGLFINTLPLRLDLGLTGVEAAVHQAQERLAALMEHEHASLALAQRCSGVSATVPLFSSVLNYRNLIETAASDSTMPEQALGATDWVMGDRYTNYPLMLTLEDFGQSLGCIVHVMQPHSPERIWNWMRHALDSLAAVLDQPAEVTMRAIDVLPQDERDLLLHAWNATQAEYPDELCVHQLFEQQVRTSPDAVALVHEGHALSYAELNASANRLAHHLIGLGAVPDQPIAICVERGPAMVAGLLAILKSGAAYVPLDPLYPSERLARVVSDAAPALLLCDAAGRAALGEAPLAACRTIDLESLFPAGDGEAAWAAQAAHDPQVAALGSAHLAYVMYTSGSTGIPKGVQVEHRQLLNFLCSMAAQWPLTAADPWLAVTSVAFDIAGLELYLPLISGAPVVLAGHEDALDPVRLQALMKTHGVRMLQATPATWNALMAAGWEGDADLTVLCGGEAMPAHFPAWFAGRCKALWNLYGPTETTIWSSVRQVLPGPVAEGGTSVPIGRPIANTRMYVLDAAAQPVPLGAIGELYIGGDGVARGYLNRPQLTAERFLPDPFAHAALARMYRTGDLARYRPDGSLECLGRTDDQVKIRGFRIELGEIEACLNVHEQVREAAAALRQDGAESRLVAYVVAAAAAPDSAALVALLRQHLQARLPEYMVPAAIVCLERLPLTPNGKLDRKALPQPDHAAYVQHAYQAPVGDIEHSLALLWQELLGVEQVGRHDDFFALGGHSLLVVRLLVRVRQTLGVELPVATFFACPSLMAMAAAVAEAGATDGATVPPMTAVSRMQPLPLSFAQQRMWFLAQLGGADPVYHMPAALRLRGQLDLGALRRSFDTLLARHEALRSVFDTVAGQPQLRLLPASTSLPLVEQELPGLEPQALELARLGEEEVKTPFNLAQGPLIRARLVRLGPEDHVLMLTQHHIVSDGWSIGVLTRELSALYQAFRAGLDNPLAPLPVQYPDYAAWQRQWLNGERLQRQADFWRAALSGMPPRLDLPTDHPRPQRQDFAAALVPFALDASTTDAVKRLSQRNGTTLFMTLMAAWAAVLARLSGQDEVVIGTPTANRGRAETHGMIGLFVNTLALPVRLSDEPSLRAILAQVRSVALAAQDHQDLPFEQVVELVQPQRNLNHSPIFQVMFNWHNNDVRLPDFGALDVEPAFGSFDFVKFDLELSLSEYEGQVVGNLKYATSLFEAATIERHAGYLQTMLQAMLADSEQPLAQVDLVGPAERQLQVYTWNDTQAPFPQERCVHALFEEQAEKTPHAVALVSGDQAFSYDELNIKANRLAHHLIALGAGVEDRIGLCLERSAEMVVGLLAVLKAGAAYVPLDPGLPSARLAQMVQDAAPVAVLSDAAGRVGLDAVALRGCALVDVQDAQAWAVQASENPHVPGLSASSMANVIFTSGSTGMPKGVMTEHRPLVNRFTWIQQGFAPLDPDDVVLQKTPFSFDVAGWEFFWPLLNGATLVMAPPQAHKDPARLVELIVRHRVTTIHFVPSMLGVFLSAGGLERCTSLRQMFCSGEALPTAYVQRTAQKLPTVQMYNLYGPTEAAIEVIAWRCPPDLTGPVLIGRPVANVAAYVLDGLGRPVPLGTRGELHIGGVAVARGYMNRPELTAERFVRDPFRADPGARLYRTGDLVRYLADGQIEYLGRNDHQVKVRGFRIELGEIEARLAAHPQVREAVVLALDVGLETRLVGYVVPAAEEVDTTALRAHLAAALPDYMVPAALIAIPAVPLNLNGKLDRKALPMPDASAYARDSYEAPEGDVEQVLATLWQDLLRVEQVGRHDDFFQLGGHSLLAVRLVAQVRQTLGVELSIATVFAQPSVATLAQAVRVAAGTQGVLTSAPIAAVSRDLPLPLSFAQQRLWFLAQWEGVSASYHIPLAVRLLGTLDRPALRRALDTLIARHESLRTVFTVLGGMPQAGLLPPTLGFDLREDHLQDAVDAAAQLDQLAEAEMRAPFDLARGPLIRGRLVRLGVQEHVLMLTQHHIVSDGWSIGVLARELSALYRAFSEGRDDPLEALAIQYPDYAGWQRQWLSGERLERQSAYWREALAGAPVLLALPTDRPRPVQQSFASASVPLELDAGLTDALRRLGRRHGTTLFMTLLAAWAAVLSRLSGQDEVVIGTPTANRGRPETEGLIGLFINTLALPVSLAGAPTVRELLARVRASTLGAQEHQDLPFEQVVEVVQPPRRLDHTPLFQVMFSWQKHEQHLLELPGLEVLPAGTGAEPVKFDLELNLNEIGDAIRGNLSYATALFDEATIVRQLGYLRTMLEAMAGADEQPVASVDLVSAQERCLQDAWNATAAPYPRERCLHHLFEDQAARDPTAIAVVHAGQELAYAELNRRANQVAHYLLAMGVQPDDRVAICVERSIDMVVGLLGILKAGAAYLPLDPAHPAERLAFMLDDGAPVLLLSQTGLLGQLPETAVPVVLLDDSVAPFAACADANPNPATLGLTSSHLAYVIYTSGSTGVPKGVMIEHASAVNLIWDHIRICGFTSADRVLQFASFGFDASVTEIFPTLSVGARLVLRPADMVGPDGRFTAFLDRHRITVTDLPTAFWHVWAQEIHLQRIGFNPTVRLVIVGGEKAERRHLVNWLQATAASDCHWLNTYGPTEATIYATTVAYAPSTPAPAGEVPIGRPVANTCIRLLDADMQPVPLGASGEIYIGGAGLARGYLNRPELTGERFIADPFSSVPGARLYKTGDVGRWLADGNIAYVGRNDTQVKLRGYRIELGEIEARLAQCEGIEDAVVLVREDEPGEKRLVAYVTGTPPGVAELRSQLGRHLADYMVPSAIVTLGQFPLTANGKLDRQALPVPDMMSMAVRQYEEPQGAVEQALAAIWQALLKVEQVGRQDDFFELGGHSLLVVQLLDRMRQLGFGTDVQTVFGAPTVARLAAAVGTYREFTIPPNRIDRSTVALTPDLLPLIDLQQSDIDRIVDSVPGGLANVQDIYGLMPLQEGLLFHHLRTQAGDPYVVGSKLSFASRALLDQFLAAAQQVVDRHDILRTAFLWDGLSAPAQVVLRHAPIHVVELALDERDGPVVDQLRERFDGSHYRMNITAAPLLHFAIAEDRANGRWAMLYLTHHLIDDHASLSILRDEIFAFLAGRADSLEAPQPFRNLVARARLGVSQEEHDAYFSKMLGDVTEPTLPFDTSELHQFSGRMARSTGLLVPALRDQLRTHARRLGVSLASLCHVAWGQVLARSVGNNRVVFGTVLLGRMQASEQAGRMIGLFINTLPFRIDLDELGVAALVKHTHAALAGLLMHEHASLAAAQQCSGVSSNQPLFSALLNYRHSDAHPVGQADAGDPAGAGIVLLGDEVRTNYPITLSVDDFGDDIGLTALVNEPLDAQRIRAYMEQALRSLAQALEKNAQMPAHLLDVLPPQERELLLQTWNATAVPYARERCLHQLFEEQVGKTPEAVAVMHGEYTLGYAQLNAYANRLARHLVGLGVSVGDRVAICVERSPAMVIGMMAILKAGAAYVPLDPTYPSGRLTQILGDAAPAVALTDAAGRTTLGEAALRSLVQVDLEPLREADGAPSWLCGPDGNLDLDGVAATNLAYIIYTSGSTGAPKGVMVEHRSVVNFHEVLQRDVYRPTSPLRIGWNASFSFDASLKGFLQLLSGHCLVIIPQAVRASSADYVAFLRHYAIDGFDITPSLLRALVAEGLLEDEQRRIVLVGGEAIDVLLWEQLRNSRISEFHNMYGPTECTMNATTSVIGRDDMVPHIGRPLGNARIYLLDAAGQPVPLGAIGEIYIGGECVARGYFNRPDLTAERFVSDPFHQAPGARMYKTGDLASYLPDGKLIYHGRNDDQVKIRGFRIELGEIEARLNELASVHQAVVIARGEGIDTRLVAYVVPTDPFAETAGLVVTLRGYLAERLPHYMLPQAYVALAALPLTPNSKLDRKALPAPESDTYARHAFIAPQGEIENALAALWCELLRIEQVGRFDDFFELGGHSLLALHLMLKVRQTFHCEIALSDLYAGPGLAELAAIIARGRAGAAPRNLVAVRPQGNQAPLFIVHPGGGGIDYARQLMTVLPLEIPLYGLQATGLNVGEEPLATVQEMASRYIDDIRTVCTHGPYRITGWSAGGSIAYEMGRQLVAAGQNVEFIGLIDSFWDLRSMGFPVSETFDDKAQLVDMLSTRLDPALFAQAQELAPVHDFALLIEQLYARGLVPEELAGLPVFDAQTVRAALHTRHAVNLAVQEYLPQPLPGLQVWMFQAQESVAGEQWAQRIGAQLHVVPLQGNHVSLIEHPEHRAALGMAISEVLVPQEQDCEADAVAGKAL